MIQILNYVEDNFTKSIICADEVLKNGEVVLVKGLADNTLAHISDLGAEGECYKVEDLEDVEYGILAMVASDGHRYDKNDMWNHGDYPDTKAGDPVRGYFLHKGMVVTIEKSLVDGEVAKGSLLSPKATSHNLKLHEAEKMVVGEVVEVLKEQGRDMVKILFY